MNRTVYALAIVIALGFAASPAAGASADAHGQCYASDAQDEGGEGSIHVDSGSPGDADLLTAEEAQSVAAAAAQLAVGTASNPGGDACGNTDNDNTDSFEEDEDHLSVTVSAQGESANVCVDNEGNQVHTTSEQDCHTNA